MSSSHSVSHSNSTVVSGRQKIGPSLLNQWPSFLLPVNSRHICAALSRHDSFLTPALRRQSALAEWAAVRHSIWYWQGNDSFVSCKSCSSHQPADTSPRWRFREKTQLPPPPLPPACLSLSVPLNILALSGISTVHRTVSENPHKETVNRLLEADTLITDKNHHQRFSFSLKLLL